MKSLYIHIPFCERKCLYCSFAVSIGQAKRRDEYLDALDKEAAFYSGTEISSLYIGGGTPTFLESEQLTRLFKILHKHFRFVPSAEVTIEANPEGMDIQKAKTLLELGVKRISLGVQSFNDRYLKYLGRVHDSFSALSVFNILRQAGFDNINVDLMFSFPGQTEEELVSDVKTVLSLKSEHISLYTLTVEENSRFFAQKICLPDNEIQGTQYARVRELLEDGGYRQYEVSNFAKSGFESQHNRHYWLGGDYIGLGMGSHSHFNGRRSWSKDRLPEYLKSISEGKTEQGFEILTPQQRLHEALVFGLRMNEGVVLSELEEKYKAEFSDTSQEKFAEFVRGGFLIEDKDRLKVTQHGQLVLDELAAYLI